MTQETTNETTHCGHGVSFKKTCRECEIVWHRNCVADLDKRIAKHRAKLEELANAG